MTGEILTRGGSGSFQRRDSSSGNYGGKIVDPNKDPELTILNQHDPNLAASMGSPPVGVGTGADEDEESSEVTVPASAQSVVDDARRESP